jgi:hypothetical protein
MWHHRSTRDGALGRRGMSSAGKPSGPARAEGPRGNAGAPDDRSGEGRSAGEDEERLDGEREENMIASGKERPIPIG